MNPSDVTLLLAEFETSWQQLFNIDNRRGTYFLHYSSCFALLCSATLLAFAFAPQHLLPVSALISLAFLVHALFGRALIGVYESERAANVRYRQKINLIREMFLGNSTDPTIVMYLSQKQLGIKVHSGSGNEIDKLGGTLAVMYSFVRVQQAACLAAILLTWLNFFFGQR